MKIAAYYALYESLIAYGHGYLRRSEVRIRLKQRAIVVFSTWEFVLPRKFPFGLQDA